MSLTKKCTISEYWNNTLASQSSGWFNKVMSRNRFQNILKFLHISDFNKDVDRQVSLLKTIVLKLFEDITLTSNKGSKRRTVVHLSTSTSLWNGRHDNDRLEEHKTGKGCWVITSGQILLYSIQWRPFLFFECLKNHWEVENASANQSQGRHLDFPICWKRELNRESWVLAFPLAVAEKSKLSGRPSWIFDWPQNN